MVRMTAIRNRAGCCRVGTRQPGEAPKESAGPCSWSSKILLVALICNCCIASSQCSTLWNLFQQQDTRVGTGSPGEGGVAWKMQWLPRVMFRLYEGPSKLLASLVSGSGLVISGSAATTCRGKRAGASTCIAFWPWRDGMDCSDHSWWMFGTKGIGWLGIPLHFVHVFLQCQKLAVGVRRWAQEKDWAIGPGPPRTETVKW